MLDFLIPSKTLQLAISLIPLLGQQNKLGFLSDWVYDKLPKKFKEKGTLQEFETVFVKGSEFIKSCYDLLH